MIEVWTVCACDHFNDLLFMTFVAPIVDEVSGGAPTMLRHVCVCCCEGWSLCFRIFAIRTAWTLTALG